MSERAMLHCTVEQRNRINQLAQQEGITQRDMLTRLMDAYLQPKDPAAPPVATKETRHRPLLQYSNGCTLRIDSTGKPYICSPDGQHWRPLENGKVQAPWE